MYTLSGNISGVPSSVRVFGNPNSPLLRRDESICAPIPCSDSGLMHWVPSRTPKSQNERSPFEIRKPHPRCHFQNSIRSAVRQPSHLFLGLCKWHSTFGLHNLVFVPLLTLFIHKNRLFVQSLRLYDVGSSVLRLEAPAEAALLDCCFQNESVAFSAGSDGFIRR